MARKASATADFGFLCTTRLLSSLFFPTTPNMGMDDSCSTSTGLWILWSKKVNIKASNTGINKAKNKAKTYRIFKFLPKTVAPVFLAGSIIKISEILAALIISASPRFAKNTL